MHQFLLSMITLLPLISLSSSSQYLKQQPLVHPHGNDAIQEDTFLAKSIFRPRADIDILDLDLPDVETLLPNYFSLLGTEGGSGRGEYDLYQGINTFAHLEWVDCMKEGRERVGEGSEGSEGNRDEEERFDIGIVGHPFDLGVSYRPGARFGPNGARQGARRMGTRAGWDLDHTLNPFQSWAKIVDCGDIGNDPFDKLVAIRQLEKGMRRINQKKARNESVSEVVRVLSLGGDHTITLPILRALHKTWGPVSVLHFDSHLDTWDPKQLGGGLTKYSSVNHGTMLHIAAQEGLLTNTSMHLGSRCSLFSPTYDLANDLNCGFSIIKARDLDTLGVAAIVRKVVDRVGKGKVYVSIDIDVLDPAFAPATGTIEVGGWGSRELLQILSGLSEAGIQIVGADVVEFTPVYDNAAETTGIAVAQIVYELLQWMVRVPVRP